MSAELIPALDPVPVPGPIWLIHVLWVVTFVIHLLFVNMVLGGSLLAAVAGSRQPHRRDASRLLVDINGWAISFAITFGIAPLLFIQVILGRFFYSATILIAPAWLGMLGFLLVGYYLNYVAKFRLKAGRTPAVLPLVAVCFLAIAVIQVTANLVHQQPEQWGAVADRAWVAMADPTFVPRLLHFVLAAVAMAGIVVAWVAVRRAAKGAVDAGTARPMAAFGVKAALITTLLQLVVGFWLLFALPEEVLKGFLRGGAATHLPLGIGILAGIVLLVMLAQIHDPLAQAVKIRRSLELLVGAVIVMVLTRHQLRSIYLEPARSGEELAVTSQWDVLGLFLLLFVVGMAVTIWAMVRAATDRPGPGEAAA